MTKNSVEMTKNGVEMTKNSVMTHPDCERSEAISIWNCHVAELLIMNL